MPEIIGAKAEVTRIEEQVRRRGHRREIIPDAARGARAGTRRRSRHRGAAAAVNPGRPGPWPAAPVAVRRPPPESQSWRISSGDSHWSKKQEDSPAE